jgi:mRNA interferase RelE/StbE
VSAQRRAVIQRRAQRDLDVLDAPTRAAIVAGLAAFVRAEPNVDVKRLQGIDPPQYRLRVGRYRVIFRLGPEAIVVERVLLRRDAYR